MFFIIETNPQTLRGYDACMTNTKHGARTTLEGGLARLQTHTTHHEIAKTKLREMARDFEELATLAYDNAELATFAACRDEPPIGTSRREAWTDRLRLLERAAALEEMASAIRCIIAGGSRSIPTRKGRVITLLIQ